MTDKIAQADLQQQAAYWFTVLRSEDCPAATRKAFELWLAEKPAHAEAYRAVEYSWEAAAFLENEPGLLELRHAALRKSVVRPSRRFWPAAGIAAVSLIAALTLIGRSAFEPVGSDSGSTLAARAGQAATGQSIATAVGERSTVMLDGGSSVELNTATALRVLFSAEQRQVFLLEGQALFDVESDHERPFIVFAGDRRVTALGTKFEVRVDRQDVTVTLLEGKVEVAELSLTAAPQHAEPVKAIELEAGQRIDGDLNEARAISGDDLSRALSWRQGRLEFRDERLSDVIYEINRYSIDAVRLSDPKLGELRVSGSFKAGSVENFVSALTSIYPLDTAPQVHPGGAKTISVYARTIDRNQT
ncbi:MAG: FecR domain-containing protein [Pseudomonadota bacterium]